MDIDRRTLEQVGQAVSGDVHARLVEWSIRPVGGGLTGEVGASGGVRRVRARSATNGGVLDWTAIRKVMVPSEVYVGDLRLPRDDPGLLHYWKREPKAYADGMLTELGEGLRAPRLYRIDETPEAIALWLEDVPDEGPERWSLGDYARAARDLGRFNGRYLAGEPLPNRPWLGRGRIGDWLVNSAGAIEAMRTTPRAGLAAAWLTDESVARTLALWDRRGRLTAVLAAMPRVLSHNDATRRNLGRIWIDGAQRTIAIDWEMLGISPLGEEIGAMVSASLQFLDASMDTADELAATVIAGYVDGLRDAGWAGDTRPVEIGFRAAACLLIGLAGAALWFIALSREQMDAGMVERIIGHPVDEIGEQWSRLHPWLLDLGEAALRTR